MTARGIIAALALLPALALGCRSAAAETAVERGAYLVRAGGCIACHTEKGGDPLAGGRPLETPFGTFYSPNITADPATGIGTWSDDDFARALHEGVRPDGARYFPVFPYTSYTLITRDDALAIKAYLFSLPPVVKARRDHDVPFPFSWRLTQRGWRMLFFSPETFTHDPAKSAEWNRGAYLVRGLAHCGECHTPRNIFGAVDEDMFLGGTADGPEGELAPNITPHATGIGDWSDEELLELLATGTKPDFDNVQGTMGEAVADGLSHLTDADRRAIVTYIRSVPPVDNVAKRAD
ncbi:MAG: cytochrome c [Pseudomonadota bacterium]|nr:cytochrome c [Pseudomonadota bacterium]